MDYSLYIFLSPTNRLSFPALSLLLPSSLTPPRTVLLLFLSPSSSRQFSETTTLSSLIVLFLPLLPPYCSSDILTLNADMGGRSQTR